jgi:hypothetical protein
MDAVQDAGNKSLVTSIGDEACARARLSTSDVAVAGAACETARARGEKAAWAEIERAAVDGRRANLNLDTLVPGRPKAPPALAASGTTPSAPQPEVATLPQLTPAQSAASSVAGNTLSVASSVHSGTADTSIGVTQSARPTDIAMGSIAYLDARNGFRDLRFGQSLASGMTLIENDRDTKFYRRASDDMKMGGGSLSEITYGFYKGHLFTVMLKALGIVDSQALLDTLRAAYGPGNKTNQFLDNYFWRGNDVMVMYEESPITHDATAVINSLPISAQKEADEKAAAARSGANL